MFARPEPLLPEDERADECAFEEEGKHAFHGQRLTDVYGLFRTRDGFSDVVSTGDVLFTLIGLAGLYFVLGLLFLYLVAVK
jgi:hypothetical protein